ncbi:hypothetical protein NQ318_016787 [Aromia moschata]|uniref:Uncharacterized protein n=1 Tax=Aromia moschata TaxID=1265417 RepID=A0AAV8Y6T0_9CUCU|nr:hypothetical protein NQ318_016787 [Aromia moschata]
MQTEQSIIPTVVYHKQFDYTYLFRHFDKEKNQYRQPPVTRQEPSAHAYPHVILYLWHTANGRPCRRSTSKCNICSRESSLRRSRSLAKYFVGIYKPTQHYLYSTHCFYRLSGDSLRKCRPGTLFPNAGTGRRDILESRDHEKVGRVVKCCVCVRDPRLGVPFVHRNAGSPSSGVGMRTVFAVGYYNGEKVTLSQSDKVQARNSEL